VSKVSATTPREPSLRQPGRGEGMTTGVGVAGTGVGAAVCGMAVSLGGGAGVVACGVGAADAFGVGEASGNGDDVPVAVTAEVGVGVGVGAVEPPCEQAAMPSKTNVAASRAAGIPSAILRFSIANLHTARRSISASSAECACL